MLKIFLNSKATFFNSAGLLISNRSVSKISSNVNKPGSEEQKYVQGQYVENKKAREYFYFLDHHGQLFLDDTKIKNFTSCYKEKKFLEFFFKKLRLNESNRYASKFPFISYCGLERNYLRCDDLPFVVSFLDEKNDLIQLNQINSSHWSFKFDPDNLFHNPVNGRLYYLFEEKEIIKNASENDPKRFNHLDNLPCRIALVKSEISIRLMERVRTEDNDQNLKFEYKSKVYNLNNDQGSKVSQLITKFSQFEQKS